MFDFFSSSWGMMFAYTPVAVAIGGLLLMPIAAGGCYALIQTKLNSSVYTYSPQANIEANNKQRRVTIGKNAFNLSMGFYGMSIMLIFYIILFCHSSVSNEEYFEVNNFLNSNQITLSGDIYSITDFIKNKRQTLYEEHVQDGRLTQIEWFTLQDQIGEMVKAHVISTKQLPENEQVSSFFYQSVNNKQTLTL